MGILNPNPDLNPGSLNPNPDESESAYIFLNPNPNPNLNPAQNCYDPRGLINFKIPLWNYNSITIIQQHLNTYAINLRTADP